MRIIIIFRKKIRICFILFLIFLSLIIILLLIHYNNQRCLNVTNIKNDNAIFELEKENNKLREILESIFPDEQKVMYENPYRIYIDEKPTFQTYDLPQIIEKGKDINFEISYNNTEYLRPMYYSRWKDIYFRRWLYMPNKIEEGHHKLFVYYGGASNIYDFEGSLGFTTNQPVDYHRNINFLVFNFNTENVKMLENQIILIGKPTRKGAQIVSVKVNDVLPKDIDSKEFLFQLSTPVGYEIDFLYGDYQRSDYLKRLREEESTQVISILTTDNRTYLELKQENQLLKQELSNYIPLEDDILITDQKCRNSFNSKISNEMMDIDKVIEKGTEIKFNVNYENTQYKRPIYDPTWKRNYQKDWAYIPTKICESMHNLFIIPTDEKEQINFIGNLAFYEKYKLINDNEIGFLIYNFTPNKIIQLNNQFIIIGIPTRIGASIITINHSNIINNSSNTVQLITPDYLEIDYETFQ